MRTARRLKHRARNAVVSAPLAFVALWLGLQWVLDERPQLRDPSYHGKVTFLADRLDKAGPEPLTIVALGSSRTACYFNPTAFESEFAAVTGRSCIAHNIARPANGPVGQSLQLRRLLNRGIRPDVVIVELTPCMTGELKGIYAEYVAIHPTTVTRKEVEFLTELGYADDGFRELWNKEHLNPYHSFRFQLIGQIQPKWSPPGVVRYTRKPSRPTGWEPIIAKMQQGDYEKNLAAAKEGFYERVQGDDIAPQARAAFNCIFETCRKQGIVAVAVFSPESTEFRDWYTAGSHERVIAMRALAYEGTGGNVFNTVDWLPNHYFSDGHHVMPDGADVYSARLAREVLVPTLRRTLLSSLEPPIAHSPMLPGAAAVLSDSHRR